jgi:chromosome segregation protein
MTPSAAGRDAAEGRDPRAERLWQDARIDSAQARHGYLVEDPAERSDWPTSTRYAFFLTPDGECFHNTTVTGGKPAKEGPLALKRELRETDASLAKLATEPWRRPRRKPHRLTRSIEELTAQLEARSAERRRRRRKRRTRARR